MVCTWMDKQMGGLVRWEGRMDGFTEPGRDRWMGTRCHSDEGGGAQEITAFILPAEGSNNTVFQGFVQLF